MDYVVGEELLEAPKVHLRGTSHMTVHFLLAGYSCWGRCGGGEALDLTCSEVFQRVLQRDGGAWWQAGILGSHCNDY